MRVYLASPNNQIQAHAASGMPVLLSYASYSPWLGDYVPSFSRLLIDWGGYTELTTGKQIDVAAFKDWSEQWMPHADAIAGCDDIRGDWRKSMKNYQLIPWTFPTMHDSDPWELLPELCQLAQERRTWLGIGLVPPREGKESFVRRVCESVPEDLHVHGWALRRYTHVRRLDSVDSTNWHRDMMKVRINPETKHLTPAECLEIVVKRYQRWTRTVRDRSANSPLFDVKEDAA